jgi:hypothetical protein
MFFGCGDCITSGECQTKVLTAVILAADSPDDTGSYCPGVFNCTGGTCVTNCSCISNMVAWVGSQFEGMQDDATFPWNTCVTAIFDSVSATTPSSTSGPGAGDCTYGGAIYGSFYATNFIAAAEFGPSVEGVCAMVQIIGVKMTSPLVIQPQSIYAGAGGTDEVTESCLEINGICSPGGQQLGTYYVPLPPYDICGNQPSTTISGGFQVVYYPYASAGTPCATNGTLSTWTGSEYTNCLSPDPFFGSDPP